MSKFFQIRYRYRTVEVGYRATMLTYMPYSVAHGTIMHFTHILPPRSHIDWADLTAKVKKNKRLLLLGLATVVLYLPTLMGQY